MAWSDCKPHLHYNLQIERISLFSSFKKSFVRFKFHFRHITFTPPSNTTELHCVVLHTNWERPRPQPTNRKPDFPSFFQQQFSQLESQLVQLSNLRVTILSFSAWTSRTSTPPSCSPSRRPWSTASPGLCVPRSTSGNHSFSPPAWCWPKAQSDQAQPNGLDKSLDFCLVENLMLNT